MIELRELTIGYKNKPISSPISGKIETKTLTAIVGPNGVGKSTLLKTICGLLPPLSGNCVFTQDGINSIAWLPQHLNVEKDFPINIFEVVSMGCWPRRNIFKGLNHKDRECIDWALNQVGIADLKEKNINSLSGGQFQRMLFARLLVQDAPIMIMDEPFVGIDEETQEVLLRLIMKLHNKGKTIITVLHDIKLVESYFTHTIKMEDGNVVFETNRY